MAEPVSKRYPSDLTNKEWRQLEPHVPKAKHGGRPYSHAEREIVNAMLYLLRTGCPWRFLPKDFPPWKTVYHYFRLWSLDGTFERMHHVIRGQLRRKLGKQEHPSACILDSQSVKTSQKGGQKAGMPLKR